MKKILLLGLCSFISLFSYSQDEEQTYRPFRFGLKASPNIGWLKPETNGYKYNGLSLGFSYGIMTDIALGTNNYAFSTGIEVAYFGGRVAHPNFVRVDNTSYVGNSAFSYNMQYLNIPLHLKLKTNEIGYLTYFAHFGVDAGMKLKSNANIEHTLAGSVGQFSYSEKKVDVSEHIRLFRPAMCIGIGTEYNISGNTSLLIGASFHNGFANIFNSKKTVYVTDSNGVVQTSPGGLIAITDSKRAHARTNYIALTVGIFF